MRIVGGSHKGRKFRAPSSIPARPTTDFAKEALFNILQHELNWSQTSMLDLFAGIGSISLEAASRGAASILSVDMNAKAINWIAQISDELKLSNIQPIKEEALKWVKENNRRFDFIFADPPYSFEDYKTLIQLVLANALTGDGVFILEHRRTTSFANEIGFQSERSYGEVKFSIFKHEQNEQ